MPFTPYHLGPALLLGFILLPFLDLPTFVMANVVIDLESLTVLLSGLPIGLHGPFHSLTLGSVAAFGLALITPRLAGPIKRMLAPMRLSQTYRSGRIFVSSVLGVWLHVVLDSFMYPEIMLFYPFEGNPLFGILTTNMIYLLSFAAFAFALIAYLFRFFTSDVD